LLIEWQLLKLAPNRKIFNTMAHILVVDDEKAIRASLKEILEFENYEVTEAKDGEEAYQTMQLQDFDAIICDIKMPKLDGMALLEKAKKEGLKGEFLMLSAHGSIDTAVEATKIGAFDFIAKPPDLNRLLVSVRNALQNAAIKQENTQLKKIVGKRSMIIGESAPIMLVKKAIEKVAPTEARVLITGPNGAGKELVARSIHSMSNRSAFPMVEVNCAAIPSELIESELFGHEKGAFTSAVKQHIGKFEQANNGTLFLDEIGDMSPSAQAKVLRALQENKITRVGGEKDININVRILAATNKDLKKEIAEGRFREDLYHRLSVILIEVPPLNARKSDIPLIAEKFMQDICENYGTPLKKLTPGAIKALQEIDYTGNVRQLHNIIERLIIMSDDEITAEDVALHGK
jgi:DNA-binding NtrC family response regulator